jgi:hypothetical protein
LVERGIVLARRDRKNIQTIPGTADKGKNSFGVAKAATRVYFGVAVRESAVREVEIRISQIIRSINWAKESLIRGDVYNIRNVRAVTRFVI